jgi:hypothetical protein
MAHELSKTYSNKSGTKWWNEASVGPDKGKRLGPVFSSKEAAIAAAKKRSSAAKPKKKKK